MKILVSDLCRALFIGLCARLSYRMPNLRDCCGVALCDWSVGEGRGHATHNGQKKEEQGVGSSHWPVVTS